MRRRDFTFGIGGVIAMPLHARAQRNAMPVIGFISSSSPGPYAPLVAAFRQGLSDTGYLEGQTVAIEYRRGLQHRMAEAGRIAHRGLAPTQPSFHVGLAPALERATRSARAALAPTTFASDFATGHQLTRRMASRTSLPRCACGD